MVVVHQDKKSAAQQGGKGKPQGGANKRDKQDSSLHPEKSKSVGAEKVVVATVVESGRDKSVSAAVHKGFSRDSAGEGKELIKGI